jgi:hypothetical protein
MKYLDVTPYEVKVPAAPAVEGAAATALYPVKDSLVNILFADKNIRARDALKRDDVARKVLAAGDELALEDAEYDILLKAVDTLEGYARNDCELIRRVLEPANVSALPLKAAL